MRTLPLWAAVATATIAVSGIAHAKPVGSIDCAMASISPKDQARWGAGLASHSDATSKAIQGIMSAAEPCNKANKWTNDQFGVVTDWMTWKILAHELARQAGFGDGDVAILRAYIDEDPRRVLGLDRFTDAQAMQLVGELRKRGAHMEASGEKMKSQLYVFYILDQMRAAEVKFAAS